MMNSDPVMFRFGIYAPQVNRAGAGRPTQVVYSTGGMKPLVRPMIIYFIFALASIPLKSGERFYSTVLVFPPVE